MPVRHGCYRLKDDGPLFMHFGMLRVFSGVVYMNRITDKTHENRAYYLDHHVNDAVRRMAFSLDNFQQVEQEWEHLFSIPFQEWGDHTLTRWSWASLRIR